jgi:hypothetical protein
VVSDRFSAYNHLTTHQRQLCWVHLIRDLTAIAERPGASAEFGAELLDLQQQLFVQWLQWMVAAIDWPSLQHRSRQAQGKRPRRSRVPISRDLDLRGRMDRKIRSKAGQEIYALRKIIVEPVFGQIKGARGLDCFLLRGLEKVNGEWALMAITHNIRKMHRAALAAA